MKKLILSLLFLSSTFAFAQISESSSLNSGKWTFGGSASINGTFGTYSTFGISVAPRVGYKISENLEFGGIASFSLLDSDSTLLLFSVLALMQTIISREIFIYCTISRIYYYSKT
jgi:hypothetical protein